MNRIAFFSYILATSLALIVIKLSTNSGAALIFQDGQFILAIQPLIILGVILYGISFLLYTYLLSRYSLGFIVPTTTAFVYVLVFIASFLLFKESFTIEKIAGIVCILIGLTLLNTTKITFSKKKVKL